MSTRINSSLNSPILSKAEKSDGILSSVDQNQNTSQLEKIASVKKLAKVLTSQQNEIAPLDNDYVGEIKKKRSIESISPLDASRKIKKLRNENGKEEFKEMTQFNSSLVDKVSTVLMPNFENDISLIAELVEKGKWETIYPRDKDRLDEEKIEEKMIYLYGALYKGLITLDELEVGLEFGETVLDPSIEFVFAPLPVDELFKKYP